MGEAIAGKLEAHVGTPMSQSVGTGDGLRTPEGSQADAEENSIGADASSGSLIKDVREGISAISGPLLVAKTLMEEMREQIDLTVKRLDKKNFKPDPIAGKHFSRIVSVISSAYKRHGYILETALLHQLKKNPNFDVWREDAFEVCKNADLLVSNSLDDPKSVSGNRVNYASGTRTLQVDIIVYDKINKTLRAYEVKRGFGAHDSGKRRSILRDVLCVDVLLKSYGENRGLDVKETASYAVFYYGVRSLPPPFALVGDDLDHHFNFPVHGAVEEINEHFRKRLFEVLGS